MLTDEQISLKEKESEERKISLREKRAEYSFNLTRNGRRISALKILEKQLESGIKPVKGFKPYKVNVEGDIEYKEIKDKEGNVIGKKPILLNSISLSTTEKIRIAKQISTLKKKLGI